MVLARAELYDCSAVLPTNNMSGVVYLEPVSRGAELHLATGMETQRLQTAHVLR